MLQDAVPGGTSFKFTVNGVDVYAKGANWVPADTFNGRVTDAMLGGLFNSYAAANFNMLRVWGGGVYQSDAFYNMADAAGFMVWQEFMFACALYPVTDPFLVSVAGEVAAAVARVQPHASVVVWGGNNENGISLGDNWYGIPAANMSQYVAEYSTLVFDTVLANFTDAWRPAVSTSPSDGDDGPANPIPTSPGIVSGDIHFYTSADCWVPSTWPRSRFTSEYGFNSYASYITMAGVTTPAQGTLADPIWAWRDHSGGAAAITAMRAAVAAHYPSPAQDTYIRDWLWMSQVAAGVCLKLETEHYRRIRDEYINNAGGNMGALYWQANDIWQGASWSTVEYGGRWKVGHYYIGAAFAPDAVSLLYDYVAQTGAVYVVHDTLDGGLSGTITLTAYGWTQGALSTWSLPFTMAGASAGAIATFTTTELLINTGCPSAAECVIVATETDGLGTVRATNWLLLSSITPSTPLLNPHLNITRVYTNGPGSFMVAFTGTAPAPFVWFETPLPGYFSTNGFMFVDVTGYNTVTFTSPNATLTAAALAATLQVWSMYDVWAGTPLPPIPPLSA